MSLRRSLRALGEHITCTVGPGVYGLVGEDAVKLHLGNVSGLANDDWGGVVFYLGVTTCTRTQQHECESSGGGMWSGDGAEGPHLQAGLVGGEEF